MSKTISRALALSALVCFCLQSADAIPARRGIINVEQPDGTVIEALLYGDEYHHYATTPDGTPLQRDAEGFLRKVDVDPADYEAEMSAMSARSPKRLRANTRMRSPSKIAGNKGYGLVPGSVFPSEGNPKALVILVEYSDVKFTLPDPYDYFSRMINERGFSDYGATGSAVDYFDENSGGRFVPQFDVYGPVTLPNDRKYYGENKSDGDDRRAHLMAVDACRLLDSSVDFSQYDNDGDGVVDNVFIFFAGEAESSTMQVDMVWPHAYFLSYLTDTPVYVDGVRLDRYACTNEWNGARQGMAARPDGVGTFIHEFSHVMGLPDLYSTNYSSAFTPGTWSALDYGPYNNNGCTPPNYSVFERYALGWLQPREIVSAANVRLEDISRNNAVMIPTPKDTEFFLFENRQQSGWDEFIPGHGMLVWHIDYDADKWTFNSVNNTVSHQNVDIEEADGMSTVETRADDAFPGGLGRTSFTDTTIPSMLPWSGRSINMPVTDIAESADGIITFKVAGGRPDIAVPVVSDATDVNPGGFTAQWSASGETGCSYTLSVYTRTSAGNRGIVYEPGYNHLAVGPVTSYVVTGLKPDTQYYYSVCTVVKEGESEPSEEKAVRTDPPTFDYLVPVSLPAEDVAHDSFTARWEPMAGATGYYLTVLTPMADGALSAVCDFTGGISGLPEGWTTTATSTYAMSSYCGQSVPSLRFTKSGQMLETRVFTDDISSLSLWARGVSTASGDKIIVEGRDMAGNWTELSQKPVTTTSGGGIIEMDVPDGIRAIRITAGQSKGSIAIDDVTVRYGTAYSDFPVGMYDKKPVGNVSEYMVSSLLPQTDYKYFVTATDGELESLPSELVALTTKTSTGVATPGQDMCTVSTEGRSVIVSGCNADRLDVFDIAGRCVASVRLSGGYAKVSVLSPGVYILAADNKFIAKTNIK